MAPDYAGRPPVFGGDPGEIHEKVIQRMRGVLLADYLPPYLDDAAADVLRSARAAYRRSGLDDLSIQPLAEDRHLLAPWTGTVGTASLAIVLTCLGHSVSTFDGMLEVSSRGSRPKDLIFDLENVAANRTDLPDLIRSRIGTLIYEKFHRYLGDDLLLSDAMSRRLDLNVVPKIAQGLCSRP